MWIVGYVQRNLLFKPFKIYTFFFGFVFFYFINGFACISKIKMSQENVIEDIGYEIKNDQDADFVINKLKDQLQYYKNKNSQYDQILSKLKITPDVLSFTSRESLDNFTKLQIASGIKKLDSIDLGMSYLEHATSKYNYQDKANVLKIKYDDLRQKSNDVEDEIKTVEIELNMAKASLENILPISESEQQKLNLQIKAYEEKMLQYINKYPWINEPEYNLLSIQEEIKKIYRLKEQVEKLQADCEIFAGLKPDIFEAKIQLENIKKEYDNICKMITEKESLK